LFHFGQGILRKLIFQQGNLVFERFVNKSLLFEFLFQIVDFADEPDNFLCSCVIFLAFGALLNDLMRGLELNAFANRFDELVGFRRTLIRDFFIAIFFWNFRLSGYFFAQFSVQNDAFLLVNNFLRFIILLFFLMFTSFYALFVFGIGVFNAFQGIIVVILFVLNNSLFKHGVFHGKFVVLV
jgi:hypothetical protein